jgi:soluble cytochrome b562
MQVGKEAVKTELVEEAATTAATVKSVENMNAPLSRVKKTRPPE